MGTMTIDGRKVEFTDEKNVPVSYTHLDVYKRQMQCLRNIQRLLTKPLTVFLED